MLFLENFLPGTASCAPHLVSMSMCCSWELLDFFPFFFFPPSFFPLSRLVSDSQKRHTEHNIFLSFHEPAFKGIIMKKRRAEWA